MPKERLESLEAVRPKERLEALERLGALEAVWAKERLEVPEASPPGEQLVGIAWSAWGLWRV